MYSRLGEPAKARRAYEQALATHPDGPLADHARIGLGRAMAALGESEGALKVLRGLAEGGNRDLADQARFQIGQVQAASGHPAEAVEAFEALEKAVAREAPWRPRRGCGRLRP